MISILLPTTGRPQMVETFYRSLVDTTDHELELVAAVDCDKATEEFLLALEPPERVQIVIDPCRYYRGCSRAWNDALEAATGDLIVFAADDLVFKPGWLEASLAKMDELPEGGGVVGFNDLAMNGADLSTHYMLSRWFIKNCLGGVIAWECYGASYNDLEVNERAKRAGRFVWAEDAEVEHCHWDHGKRPKDETDARMLGDLEASTAAYRERSAAGFPDG